MQAATAGTAASGVIVALLRVMAKAAGGGRFEALRAATAAYFSVALAVCAAAAALYSCHLRRLPLYIKCKREALIAYLEVRIARCCSNWCLCAAAHSARRRGERAGQTFLRALQAALLTAVSLSCNASLPYIPMCSQHTVCSHYTCDLHRY